MAGNNTSKPNVAQQPDKQISSADNLVKQIEAAAHAVKNVTYFAHLSSSVVNSTSILLHKYEFLSDKQKKDLYLKRENIRFVYNYYDEKYQQINNLLATTTDFILKNTNYSERFLPNYYNDFFAITGAIKSDVYDGLSPQRQIASLMNDNYALNTNEFLYHGQLMSGGQAIPALQQKFSNKNRNIVLEPNYTDKVKKDFTHNDKTSLFPFYVNVEFNRETTQSQLKTPFKNWGGSLFVTNVHDFDNKITDGVRIDLRDLDNTSIIDDQGTKKKQIDGWIKEFDFSGQLDFATITGLSTKNLNFLELVSFSAAAINSINNLINEHKNIPATTIYYKINKSRKNAVTEVYDFVQQIFVPNSDDLGDKISYIDSQVFQNQEYGYEIFAIKLQIFNGHLYIYEVPYLTKITVLTHDYYFPLPPDVDIVPYKNVSDKMLFLFENGIGQYREKLQYILPEDDDLGFGVDNALLALTANKALEIEPPLTIDNESPYFPGGTYIEEYFKQSCPIEKIQVFRTDIKPVSYINFASSLYYELDYTTATAWRDDYIEPNKKYYYCFRTINKNGRISNPTWVYQIEIVKNSGASYPIFDFFKPTDEVLTINSKDFTRFVYLKPKPLFFIPDVLPPEEELNVMEYLNEQLSTQIEAAKLDDITLHTFKFRITSKRTNKSIDYNMKYNKKILTYYKAKGP